MNVRIKTVAASLLVAVTVIAPPVALAEEQAVHRFDLPAQPLAEALRAIARQTGANVLFESKDLSGIRIEGLRGRLTTSEAIQRVLEGTKLEAQRTTPTTVVVQPASADSSTRGVPAEPRQGVRLDQSDTPSSYEGESTGQGFGETTANRPGASARSENDADSARASIEEVLVTAQKREERIIDVPISIVAVDADELEKRRVTNLDQLPFAVPGLAIENVGWQRRVILRGIGNVQGQFSLIGLYLDEAAVTTTGVSQLDLGANDLERVEVLRGPQGTLYGEGSAGGTIRFITKSPDLDRFSGSMDVTGLFTKGGELGQRVAAVVNMPIADAEFGIRVAGTYDHGGGWIDQPAAGREDINGQNRRDVRVKALWRPTAQLAVNAMSVIHRNDTSTGTGEDDRGNYTQVFNLGTTPKVEDDYELHNLTLTYDFAKVRVLNSVSYVDQDRESTQVGYIFPTNPGAPVSNVLQNPYSTLSEVLTEELRFTSSGAGPWQWTLGGTYRDAQFDLRARFNFGVPGAVGAPLPASIPNNNTIITKSWAVFGDTSYQLTQRLNLGVGLRYFKDDQEYRTATVQTGSFDTTNPRLYAQYKVTDNFNIYTSAAKGFRSGGFNALNQPLYDSEKIWTYELGTKSTMAGGVLGIDVAVFYSNYSDYQIVGLLPPPSPPLNITSNAGDARVRGVEWQFTLRPADGWRLGFNGDYLDTEFLEIDVTRSPFIVGDAVPMVPEYTLVTTAQRDFSLGARPGFARLDYSVQGRMSYRNRNIGTLYQGESAVIQMLNLSAELEWNPHFTVMLFAENLLDDRGFSTPYHFLNNSPRPRPRTFGVQFGMSF